MSTSDRGHDDPRLTDQRLAAEIELLGALITAAATHDGPLSVEEIDAALWADDEDDEQGA
jgi:hypothetical protein